MSILSAMPTGWLDDYYEPADIIDEDDDTPAYPPDSFTLIPSGGWFAAGTDLSDE